jgi:pyruvate dehydrogenase E2 component (dihydrolipoamide acetyltransferase)
MLASVHQTAAVTLTTEVDASHLVAMRTQLNEGLAERLGFRIAYHDILIYIAARALREFPYLNARQEGEAIRRLPNVHMGLAVDTERGLLVPVLREADRKSIVQIARETREKIERALAGRSLPDELSGGTFTLTNLGMYGIDAFTPIINPPELAILGIGRIEQKPAAYQGSVQLRHRMALSLSFDHRLVDGGPAARFLRRVTELIEKPYLMLADEI